MREIRNIVPENTIFIKSPFSYADNLLEQINKLKILCVWGF